MSGDISYENLTNEELIKMAQSGDDKAYNLAAAKNEGLIRFIANKFRRPHQSYYEDVVDAGRLGLVKAIKKYNPERNASFIAYSYSCIHNEICLFIRHYQYEIQGKISSLNEPIIKGCNGDEDLFLEDILVSDVGIPEKTLDDLNFNVQVKNIVKSLPEREQYIFVAYILNDENQESIAKKLGITQSRVSHLIIRIRNKLKEVMKNERLS